MPEIQNVVPGEPVESQWGNLIRDRVAQRYADAANRTAETPLPLEGELSYLEDVDALEVYDGTDWLRLAYVGDPDGGYVLVAGDTMTGVLRINKALGGAFLDLLGDDAGTIRGARFAVTSAGALNLQVDAGDQTYVNAVTLQQNAIVLVDEAGAEMGRWNRTDRVLQLADGVPFKVLGAELTLTGSGVEKIRYTNAGAAVQTDRDAIWVSTGVPPNYRLDTIASLADEAPEVAALMADYPTAVTAKADPADGPVLREIVHALVQEVASLRSRIEALEA